MLTSKLVRALVAASAALAVAGGGPALAAVKKKPTLLGPNLVVNPSFEESTLDPATANGIPVLPVGWTFEGATILFDYNQRGGRTGARSAAISGSLAPGAQVCDASVDPAYICVPNPAAAATGQVNEQAAPQYSIRPVWLNQAPIAVKPGKAYRFGMWSIRPSLAPDAGAVGEGAASFVRWLDAAGKPISVVPASTSVKGPKRQLGFRQSSADVVAPAGAAGAQLLLGHTDYTVTSAQVAFDDITFQEIIRK